MILKTPPRRRLIATALGHEPADLVIRNGVLLDVHGGRFVPDRSVAVLDRWIAYVGPDASHTIGGQTKVIDAENRIISPGYMDTHTHLGTYWDLSEFLRFAMPGGTTTYITEIEAYAYALGARGVGAFLEQTDRQPVKVYCLVPPMVTISPAQKSLYITPADLKELLQDDRVIGLGETYWQDVVNAQDSRTLELMEETLRAGKSVQGHAAGAFDRKLSAYAAAGVMSCHESISTEDVLSRLEMGFYVMVREGYIRRDLEILLPLKDSLDLRRVILVTDGTTPDLLLKRGYLVDVLQKAVDLGIDPVRVVQMATINPAEHFGISHLSGSIAPTRFADILLLPGKKQMQPDLVISEGRIVAEEGRVSVPLPKAPVHDELLGTIKIGCISPDRLRVPLDAACSRSYLRTMDIQPGGLVAREGKAEPRIVNGQMEADRENDLMKAVFIEGISGREELFVGFVKGWGQREGAAATTLSWEAFGVVAVGADDQDLSLAINKVIEMQGGAAVSARGSIRTAIPFDLGGFRSRLPMERIAAGLNALKKEMVSLGSPFDNPHLALMVLTTASIPFIRITEKGYYRYRENDYVGL